MASAIKLSKLEYQLMEILWKRGASSVREIQQELPEKRRLAYTTVQTTVFRMETKGAIRRTGQVGMAYVFEALITRQNAQHALIEDLLAMFGGTPQPVMAHLVESGRISLKDVKEVEELLRAKNKGKKS